VPSCARAGPSPAHGEDAAHVLDFGELPHNALGRLLASGPGSCAPCAPPQDVRHLRHKALVHLRTPHAPQKREALSQIPLGAGMPPAAGSVRLKQRRLGHSLSTVHSERGHLREGALERGHLRGHLREGSAWRGHLREGALERGGT